MILDARFVAGPVTDAAISFSMSVLSAMHDARSAIDDSDTATAIECLGRVFLELRYCNALLDGHVVAFDHDILAAFVHAADEAPLPSWRASREEVDLLLDDATQRCSDFLARLPFRFPLVRTPEGFFPTLRLMRELDSIRDAVGLVLYQWSFGAT